MTILQKQEYYQWFQYLGSKAIEWKDKSKNNPDINNILKATNCIGLYVLQLEKENEILKMKIDLERSKNLKNK